MEELIGSQKVTSGGVRAVEASLVHLVQWSLAMDLVAVDGTMTACVLDAVMVQWASSLGGGMFPMSFPSGMG